MAPFSRDELKVKINQIIDDRLEAGLSVATPWLSQYLVQSLSVPNEWNVHLRDEAILVLYEGYRQIVQTVIRNRRQDEVGESSKQPKFPGFERLQDRYIIVRDGVETVVRTEQITKDEFIHKRDQLIEMRDGLDRHILEIERFIANKWPA